MRCLFKSTYVVTMWSRGDIRFMIKQPSAHRQLLTRKMTLVSGREEWVNGYEFGLFMSEDMCLLLAETMHLQGFLIDDVVSPFIQHLALRRGYAQHVRNLRDIQWSVPIIKGLMRRPDIHMLLRERSGILNGYEHAVFHDYELSQEIGRMIRHQDMCIHQCIRFQVFKQSPLMNVRALFMP